MAKYELADRTVNVIIDMCDIVLKAGGLVNKPAVDLVMSEFQDYIKIKLKEEENKQKKEAT